MKNYRDIIEPLICYTCKRFNEMTLPKLTLVTMFYETIIKAMGDLHHGSSRLRDDASNYFSGDLFLFHCKCNAIPSELMLRIVNNPDKIQDIIVPFEIDDEWMELENNEAFIEFSDLS